MADGSSHVPVGDAPSDYSKGAPTVITFGPLRRHIDAICTLDSRSDEGLTCENTFCGATV